MSDTDQTAAPLDLDAEIARLAARYSAAGNLGVQILSMLNWPADALLARLPQAARGKLETLTARGLEAAMSAAAGSRGVIRDQSPWVNTVTAAASGVVGGFGGLATSLAEIPVTVTLLMRAIQGVAAGHGFDADEIQTRRDCLLVFAADGPIEGGKGGMDLNFLASRATLSGVNVYIGIGLIAPRLAAVLGRKLAAQTVPVLGAATAGATNYAYTGYYQEVAHVVFGLRSLSERSGVPFAELADRLRQSAEPPLARRAS